MKELRVQINMRGNPDVNISLAFTHIVDDGTDVAALGEEDSATVLAYFEGYARGATA